MHNFHKQTIAWVLLIGLFLESCSNPYLGMGKKELMPQFASNKNVHTQEAEMYGGSLSSPILPTGDPTQLNEPAQDNLALIQPMDLSQGTELFKSKDSHQQNETDGNIPALIQAMDRVVSKQDLLQASLPNTKQEKAAAKQPKQQATSNKKPSFSRRNRLSGQNHLSKSQQVAKHKRSTSPASKALEEEIKAAGELVPPIPVTSSNREESKEADTKSYVAKGGYEVQFKQLTSGKWQATVEQFLPGDSKRRLLLPVYLASGYSIASLSEHSPSWQKAHIHVVLQKAKSYVVVGNMGLSGGMMEEEDEPIQNGKQEVDRASTNSNTIHSRTVSLPVSASTSGSWDASPLPKVLELSADEARMKLGKAILLATDAEADERLNVHYQLEQALRDSLVQDGELRGGWNALWRKLEEPELLIIKKQNLGEQVFEKYKGVYEELRLFKGMLVAKFPNHPEWAISLDKIVVFYDQFRHRLSKTFSDPSEFHSLIEPKALLMGEWWPGCFYRISQSQAHYLLGQDEHGEKLVPKVPDKSDKKIEESKSNHHVAFYQQMMLAKLLYILKQMACLP
jgi:hypothetical protein